ncbi:MAG: hypothetical protein K6E86_05155 [Bacteroidales bacterium]|nr:hypothetical protein [Bacteroidales bacterium]
MKKFLTLAMAAIAAVCTFTSCDDDEKTAMRLSGEWEGEFYAYYEYYYKSERTPRREYASNTYMQFVPDHLFGSTKGTGYEVDFYNDGPIEYMFYEFDYKITDGVLYLTYFDAEGMDVAIQDYRLSYDRFKGYFGENRSSFELYKLDSFDHTQYVSPFKARAVDYINEYYGCGRTRVAEGDAEETELPIEIISHGHHKR